MSDNYSHFTKSQQITTENVQQLRPKAVVEYRTVWRRIKDNGYDVIPLKMGKDTPFKGWPTLPNTPEDIETWTGRAAAVRLYGSGLFFIDIDVLLALARDRIVAMLTERWPDFMAKCLRRHSGGVKVAFIGRVKTGQRGLHTLKHQNPALPEGSENRHHVELFNGNCKRYVAVHGMHSVEREYGYEGRSILEVLAHELPLFPEADLGALIDACSAILAECGLEPIIPAHGKEYKKLYYDIDDATRFDVLGGPSGVDYDAIVNLLHERGELRVSGSFIDGAHNRTKCRVDHCRITRSVGVFDYEGDSWHCHKSTEPPSMEALAEDLKKLRVVVAEIAAPGRPDQTAGIFRQAQWLLRHYGYCASSNLVVELHRAEDACHRAPKAFTQEFRSWHDVVTGPRKGNNVRYATSIWDHHADRATIAGIRMRPDRPFPLYEDGGQMYKNTYLKPAHEGEGDLAPFLDFMERFLPDEGEREWFYDWMANKLKRPEVPGSSVWFVADTVDATREGKFGTGRGFMFRIGHKLYGEAYARAEDFDILSGASSQSAYTDWMHNSVLITIDEANTSPTGYRRGQRRSVYEVLKNVIDPAPKRRRFKVKHGAAFDGMSYCSFWVGTNHGDAAAIPASDRRMSVLRNGREMTPAEGIAINAWIETPGNMAALSRGLAARDLGHFNMYAALKTIGKDEMVEYTIGRVEEFLLELMEGAHKLVFTRGYLEEQVRSEFTEGPREGTWWRGEFEALWSRYCKAVKNSDGGPRRTREGGTRKKLFCFRADGSRVRDLSDEEFAAEVDKHYWRDLKTGSQNDPGPDSGSRVKDE